MSLLWVRLKSSLAPKSPPRKSRAKQSSIQAEASATTSPFQVTKHLQWVPSLRNTTLLTLIYSKCPNFQSWVHGPYLNLCSYNNSGKSRGYPDISANGANYFVSIDGTWQLIYGTSASAPTVGSIFTLINEQRANAGKKSVGFINPVLYANSKALNDITSGYNRKCYFHISTFVGRCARKRSKMLIHRVAGCLTNGFQAVAGWDPVTGLGTPNYPKLLKVFMALP